MFNAGNTSTNDNTSTSEWNFNQQPSPKSIEVTENKRDEFARMAESDDDDDDEITIKLDKVQDTPSTSGSASFVTDSVASLTNKENDQSSDIYSDVATSTPLYSVRPELATPKTIPRRSVVDNAALFSPFNSQPSTAAEPLLLDASPKFNNAEQVAGSNHTPVTSEQQARTSPIKSVPRTTTVTSQSAGTPHKQHDVSVGHNQPSPVYDHNTPDVASQPTLSENMSDVEGNYQQDDQDQQQSDSLPRHELLLQQNLLLKSHSGSTSKRNLISNGKSSSDDTRKRFHVLPHHTMLDSQAEVTAPKPSSPQIRLSCSGRANPNKVSESRRSLSSVPPIALPRRKRESLPSHQVSPISRPVTSPLSNVRSITTTKVRSSNLSVSETIQSSSSLSGAQPKSQTDVLMEADSVITSVSIHSSETKHSINQGEKQTSLSDKTDYTVTDTTSPKTCENLSTHDTFSGIESSHHFEDLHESAINQQSNHNTPQTAPKLERIRVEPIRSEKGQEKARNNHPSPPLSSQNQAHESTFSPPLTRLSARKRNINVVCATIFGMLDIKTLLFSLAVMLG